jgi:3-isopropylmalate dehydrogenase
VIAQGLKALEAVAGKLGIRYRLVHYDFGGDRYMRTGEILPDSALDELRRLDAIYLGAIGHPDVKPGILEKGIILNLRFALDQYINLRPVLRFELTLRPVRSPCRSSPGSWGGLRQWPVQ